MQVESPELKRIQRISTAGFTYIYSHVPGATGRLHEVDNLPNIGTQISKKVEEDDEFTLEKHSDHLINTLRYEYTLEQETKIANDGLRRHITSKELQPRACVYRAGKEWLWPCWGMCSGSDLPGGGPGVYCISGIEG